MAGKGIRHERIVGTDWSFKAECAKKYASVKYKEGERDFWTQFMACYCDWVEFPRKICASQCSLSSIAGHG